jgi:catechol-2,3-dioxygenase
MIFMIEKLESASAKSHSESHWHLVALGIHKKDREIWKKHLKSSGVGIESESPHSLYFRDLEGNHVCLSHYKS